MQHKCPQCGKIITVSPEELAMHDNCVVCPQCLTSYHVEGNTLTVQQVVAQRRPAADTAATGASYCYHCGKSLPSGINFCPYCGVDLMAPFAAGKSSAQADDSATAAEPADASDARSQREREAAIRRNRDETTQERSDVLRQIAAYPRSVARRTVIKQRGSYPSRRFQVFAFITIALLLALLAVIIVAGLNIQPA